MRGVIGWMEEREPEGSVSFLALFVHRFGRREGWLGGWVFKTAGCFAGGRFIGNHRSVWLGLHDIGILTARRMFCLTPRPFAHHSVAGNVAIKAFEHQKAVIHKGSCWG